MDAAYQRGKGLLVAACTESSMLLQCFWELLSVASRPGHHLLARSYHEETIESGFTKSAVEQDSCKDLTYIIRQDRVESQHLIDRML